MTLKTQSPWSDRDNDKPLNEIETHKYSTKQTKTNQSDDGFKLVGIKDLLTEPKPLEWLVENYILQETQVQLVGSSGLGKSFLAIDLALSVATGKQWNSCDVKQGPVAYINAEGHTGFQHRLKGWTIEHQKVKDEYFCLSNGPVDMMCKYSIKSLTTHLDKFAAPHNGHISLIVLDTLRRNTSGNEDDSKDTSVFINNLEKLCKRYGATGFIIHHPGHNNTGRARGSSSQKAALDTVLLLKKDKEGVGLICTKLKDGGAIPDSVGYELEVVTIPWLDSKGNCITTCIPSYDEDSNAGGQSLKPMTTMIDMAIDALNNSFNGVFGDDAPLDEWESTFTKSRLSKTPYAKHNTIKKSFNRSKDELIDKGVVILNDKGNYQFGHDIEQPWSDITKHLTPEHFNDYKGTEKT